MAHVLTDKDSAAITQVSALLATMEGRIASVIADGAVSDRIPPGTWLPSPMIGAVAGIG